MTSDVFFQGHMKTVECYMIMGFDILFRFNNGFAYEFAIGGTLDREDYYNDEILR